MTAPVRRCRSCGGAVAPRAGNRAFPFCIDRCRLADLGRWLDGSYRIAAERGGDGADGDPGGDPRGEGEDS